MITALPTIPIDLFAKTARELKLQVDFVEKDYWAISLLKKVLNVHEDLVFKGGTALSKGFRIIDRFSEDIDISLKNPHYSVGEKRKITHAIRDLIPSLGMTLENGDTIRSKRAFNRLLCNYSSRTDPAFATGTVILELANQTPCFPTETRMVQTYVGEFLNKVARTDLIKDYHLEAFSVSVQTLERTFVDKVFALCDYFMGENKVRQSRHIFDLHAIFPAIKMDDSLFSLFTEVRKYREPLTSCLSAKEGIRLGETIAKVFSSRAFEEDYKAKTVPLLRSPQTYEQVASVLPKIAEWLNQRNL